MLKLFDSIIFKHALTEGSLEKIMKGINIKNPVLQVLGCRKLPKSFNKDSNKDGTYRYWLHVSDGLRCTSFTMLATQLNNLIEDYILTKYAICEISDYRVSLENIGGKEKSVILLMGIKVFVPGNEVGHIIREPVKLENILESDSIISKLTGCHQTIDGTAQKNTSNNSGSSDISATPIAALSPYQNNWVIKVRVTSKTPIKTWSNSRGKGRLFSMDLIDGSSEIRCTAFREMCDKFYNMIEPGNVYYISRCILKAANKQFNSLKNNYEMTMTNDTEIVPCHKDIEDIPMIQFNFCSINDVENKEKGDIIDVLGVVTCNDVLQLIQRTTGRELVKRDINIVDDSGAMITVTLWGKQAEDFDGFYNPIVAIKGARIEEFNGGKNLSLLSLSVLVKDPDLPEAHRLRGWYTSGGHSENVKSLSKAGGGGHFNSPLYTFQEATEAQLGEMLNISDNYTVVATINLIRVESSIYKACPIESCKKKLIDQSTGIFRCDKCNKDYPNFAYRLLASMNIADATGSRWITAFNKNAEKILGMSAQELGELKETDNNAYMQKFSKASFKRFTFSLRARSEVFQDEMRVRHTCSSVAPLNYKTHLTHLIDRVSKLVHIEKYESN